MARKEVSGGAGELALYANINNSVLSLQASNDVTGWPTGAVGNFVLCIERDTAKEERMLCSALSGTGPATITVVTRGYDGTTAQSHDSGVVIEHVLDANSIDDLMDHVYDTTRDDHTGYILKAGTRAFTGVGSIAGSPVAVGASAADGTAVTLARSDHVHNIADAIITAAKVASGNAIIITSVAASRPASAAVGTIHFATDTYVLSCYTAIGWGNVLPHKASNFTSASAHAYRNANQGIANGGGGDVMSWDTEGHDTDAIWSAGNPTRFTLPFAGLWAVTCTVESTDLQSTGTRSLTMKRNGGAYSQTENPAATIPAHGMLPMRLNASGLINVAASDYIEWTLYQNEGSAQNWKGHAAVSFMGTVA